MADESVENPPGEQLELKIPDEKVVELFKHQAEKLHNIVCQRKINDRGLVEVVKYHNWIQRQAILTAYQQLYNGKADDFALNIEAKLSRDFKTIILNSFRDRYQLWADLIREQLNSRKQSLLHITCYIILQNDDDTNRINKCLGKPQDELLEELVDNKYRSSKILPLLLAVLRNQTAKNYRVSDAAAALKKAAQGYGVNEAVFVKVLTSTTYRNFKRLADEMEEAGTPIAEMIKEEFGADKDAYLAYSTLYQYNIDPPQAVAWLLKKSKDSELDINLTILFSDYMREDVVDRYKKHGSLEQDIRKEIGGQAKILMAAMWGLDTNM